MSDCATATTRFDTLTELALEVAFDGGRLTSDGGLALIAQVDTQLGLCEVLARHVPEWRRGQVKHSLLELVRQRVYQIACGYEDPDDADHLRADPLLKLVCGSLPETGADLASQATMSRLENAVTATACYRMAQALGEVYIQERGKGGVPKRILLDFDGTDETTHGGQEGSCYHGYYRQHLYHPLLVRELRETRLRADRRHRPDACRPRRNRGHVHHQGFSARLQARGRQHLRDGRCVEHFGGTQGRGRAEG